MGYQHPAECLEYLIQVSCYTDEEGGFISSLRTWRLLSALSASRSVSGNENVSEMPGGMACPHVQVFVASRISI